MHKQVITGALHMKKNHLHQHGIMEDGLLKPIDTIRLLWSALITRQRLNNLQLFSPVHFMVTLTDPTFSDDESHFVLTPGHVTFSLRRTWCTQILWWSWWLIAFHQLVCFHNMNAASKLLPYRCAKTHVLYAVHLTRRACTAVTDSDHQPSCCFTFLPSAINVGQ